MTTTTKIAWALIGAATLGIFALTLTIKPPKTS